jgi:outer membrane protein TolC
MNRPNRYEQSTRPPYASIRGVPIRTLTTFLLSIAVFNVEPAKAETPASAPLRPNQESTAPLAIDLMTAMALAERNAPDLLVPAAEQQSVPLIRSAADRLVHRPPRVTLSTGPRRLAGGAQLGWDVTAGVFQEFSTGGYGRQLGAFASAVERRANATFASVQRDARVRAGLAWIDARLARETLALREQAWGGAKETVRVAEARAQVGKSSPAEASLARALMGSIGASVLSAHGDITVADAELRYWCRVELHRSLLVSGPIDVDARPIDEDGIRHHVIERAPELARLRAEADTLAHAANLGKSVGKPHIEIGPSVTREGTGDWIFLGNISVPLPGVDPFAADNAIRRTEAEIARARVAVAEQGALKEVEVALHEREHALELRESLRSGTIEPSTQAVREYQLQYEVGRIDLTTVLAARRELLNAQERWAAAAADVLRAEVRLMRWSDTILISRAR